MQVLLIYLLGVAIWMYFGHLGLKNYIKAEPEHYAQFSMTDYIALIFACAILGPLVYIMSLIYIAVKIRDNRSDN